MANISIGASGMIGRFSCTPIRSAPQPHWKTATTTPYAAATLNTLSSAAFSGTSIDRNTSISTMNDSPMTAARKYGIRCCSRDEMSSTRAVDPVTDASTVVPSTAFGTTSVRNRSSVAAVFASWGAVVGVTEMTARSFFSDSAGSSTEATPLSAARSLVSWSMTALAFGESWVSTTTASGPLTPSPYLSAIRS